VWVVDNARVESKGSAVLVTKQTFWLGQDQFADGGVQCNRVDGFEPGIGSAEHFLALVEEGHSTLLDRSAAQA
jgi:hypothetical protein